MRDRARIRVIALIVRELARAARLVLGMPDCVTRHTGVALEALPWLTPGPFQDNRIARLDRGGRLWRFPVARRLAGGIILAIQDTALQGAGVAILPQWFVAARLRTARCGTFLRACAVRRCR